MIRDTTGTMVVKIQGQGLSLPATWQKRKPLCFTCRFLMSWASQLSAWFVLVALPWCYQPQWKCSACLTCDIVWRRPLFKCFDVCVLFTVPHQWDAECMSFVFRYRMLQRSRWRWASKTQEVVDSADGFGRSGYKWYNMAQWHVKSVCWRRAPEWSFIGL